MKLVVTGAGGMVGSHVARRAAAMGHEVHKIVRTSSCASDESATVHVADLLDPGAADALLRQIGPSHLVHAAWETSHGTYWSSLQNLAWVEATSRLARAFAEAGGTRFVQVGSCAEYEWRHGRCIEGHTPERPATRYGMAKLAAWKCVEAAALGSFEAAEARIFFAYGPGENAARLIPYICRSHIAGEVPSLSSGRQIRDLLHVEDTAAAVLAVAEADALEGPVNIGGGQPAQLGEAARRLAEVAGAAHSGLGLLSDRDGDPEVLVPDIGRLFSTGWRPTIPLAEGLARTFEYWAATEQHHRAARPA